MTGTRLSFVVAAAQLGIGHHVEIALELLCESKKHRIYVMSESNLWKVTLSSSKDGIPTWEYANLTRV